MPGNKRSAKIVLKHKINGVNFRPSADPPSIVSSPWHQLTIPYAESVPESESTATVKVFVTFDEFFKTASKHLFGTIQTCQVRIESIKIWELKGHSIIVDFSSLTNLGEYINTAQDYPGRNQWARVGYMYPVSHRNRIFLSSETKVAAQNLLRIRTLPGASLFIQIRLLIKHNVATLNVGFQRVNDSFFLV